MSRWRLKIGDAIGQLDHPDFPGLQFDPRQTVSNFFLLGFEDVFLDYIQTRPGIALFFGGALATTYGFTLMLGRDQANCGGLRILASIPGRIFGLLLLVLGSSIVLLGILEMIIPNIFINVIDFLKGLLPSLPDFDL